MILQNIIFPNNSICSEKDLYFHAKNDSFSLLDNGMQISENNCIDFFSYFNGFTIEKWLRYTTVEKIYCKVQISGKCRVSLFQNKAEGERINKICLHKLEISSEDTKTILIEVPSSCTQGICSLKIEAIKDTHLICGSFDTDSQCLTDVHLIIGICTYRRENFVQRTLKTIQNNFLKNSNSPLAKRLQIIVSDNGQTLDAQKWEDDCIHIYKNKNAGGTGGFTRCMIESLTTFSDWAPTHILLMDDDIILEPEALYRTYTFLSYLKKTYQEYVIGGALLRMDIPYIQFANGEGWENGYVQFTKKGYNLKNEYTLLQNEEELPISHNGWWYCCLPISSDMENSLPFPFFIHADDIEYGLRKEGKFITLNGICVWHDSFDNRKSSAVEYYDIRNAFICSLIHIPEYSAKDMKKRAYRHLIHQLLKYRYADQELFMLGIQHALQGIQFLKDAEPVSLHAQITKMGYHEEDLRNTLSKLEITIPEKKATIENINHRENIKLWHVFTLNGWLLPGKRKITAIPMGAYLTTVARAKKVLYYDPATGKGFFTERKFRALFTTLKNCIKARKLISKNFDNAARDIRENWRDLTTLTFWKKYLDL